MAISILPTSFLSLAIVVASGDAFAFPPSTPSARGGGGPSSSSSSARAAPPSSFRSRSRAAAAASRTSRTTQASLGMSSGANDNMPSEEEMIQQKREAYDALASFHETSRSFTQSPRIRSLLEGLDGMGGEEEDQAKPEYWECKDGAVAYGVPMDPAAGLKRGVVSKPYECSVQFEMDAGGGGRGLRLVESIKFGDGEDDNDGEFTMPFVRSIRLGANVDVDAVDGSYSLDDAVPGDSGAVGSPSLPLLPPSLLVGLDPTAIHFLVEHALATSETERCRCFFLYGDASAKSDDGDKLDDMDGDGDEGEDDVAIIAARRAREDLKQKEGGTAERSYRLLGVVLAEETKKMPQPDETTTEDHDEEEDYAAEFISQMIESPSRSPSSPLDLLKTTQSGTEDDKMSRLMESLDRHNQKVIDSAAGSTDGNTGERMERHSPGMFGLTSGVWLGDAFIREPLPSRLLANIGKSRQATKGFGKKGRPDGRGGNSESKGDRFATWTVGVQKVALRFEWDYSESVSQSYTYGKCMGTPSSTSSMASIKSNGMVVVNEGRRTRRREDKRVVWDMDSGAYVSALIGSGYLRAPRYLSFSGGNGRGYGGAKDEAYLTEFMSFYRSGTSNDAETGEGASDPDYYCSRSSRLYDAVDGSLMQGSTAFFSKERPVLVNSSMEP